MLGMEYFPYFLLILCTLLCFEIWIILTLGTVVYNTS